jgi:hypothetical protein
MSYGGAILFPDHHTRRGMNCIFKITEVSFTFTVFLHNLICNVSLEERDCMNLCMFPICSEFLLYIIFVLVHYEGIG